MKLQVVLFLILSVNLVICKRIMVGGDCKNDCIMRKLVCDGRCDKTPEESCYEKCRNLLSACLEQPCARFAEFYHRRYY
uniref:Uncharacterized protein n=1 Tax=Trichobilharzia regenti TaxID=157069 RepID=A0AA85KEA6_TRIRE|nr:unnamed protein product [Trichobilharzia regenti]